MDIEYRCGPYLDLMEYFLRIIDSQLKFLLDFQKDGYAQANDSLHGSEPAIDLSNDCHLSKTKTYFYLLSRYCVLDFSI